MNARECAGGMRAGLLRATKRHERVGARQPVGGAQRKRKCASGGCASGNVCAARGARRRRRRQRRRCRRWAKISELRAPSAGTAGGAPLPEAMAVCVRWACAGLALGTGPVRADVMRRRRREHPFSPGKTKTIFLPSHVLHATHASSARFHAAKLTTLTPEACSGMAAATLRPCPATMRSSAASRPAREPARPLLCSRWPPQDNASIPGGPGGHDRIGAGGGRANCAHLARRQRWRE